MFHFSRRQSKRSMGKCWRQGPVPINPLLGNHGMQMPQTRFVSFPPSLERLFFERSVADWLQPLVPRNFGISAGINDHNKRPCVWHCGWQYSRGPVEISRTFRRAVVWPVDQHAIVDRATILADVSFFHRILFSKDTDFLAAGAAALDPLLPLPFRHRTSPRHYPAGI